jgi:hypothetical protein
MRSPVFGGAEATPIPIYFGAPSGGAGQEGSGE